MMKVILAAVLAAGPALAQPAPMPGHAMPMPMPMPMPQTGQGGSTAAYAQAMQTMMHAMDTPYTGDPDRDFVTGMLPHHAGAVDMAKVELQYGHDPALKTLARSIIQSQTKEEAFMRAWLARHPAPAAPHP